MSAFRKKVAVAVLFVLPIALAGGVVRRGLRPPPIAHVEMLAFVPKAAQVAPRSAAPAPAPAPSAAPTPSASRPEISAPSITARREDEPEPPSAPNPVDAPRTEAAAPPSFDVVRVEPSGDALLAGRSKANAKVTLVDRGKVVAEAKADAAGNFVMIPPALKPGDYALSLREGQGAATRDSEQSVVVSVPASKTQQVAVALAEPGKATKLLSAPLEAAAPAVAASAAPAARVGAAPPAAAKVPAAPPKLAIRSVELENGSGLFASGVAAPGADVRLYLNDSRVADVVAAAAGAWTVTVRKGLSAGRYAVRADALKPDRRVGARVEVPFDVPVSMGDGGALRAAGSTVPSSAAGRPQATSAAASAIVADAGSPGAETERSVAEAPAAAPRKKAASPADAVVDELQTELVTRGDNLWRISRKRLGHGTRYTQIYAANAAQIRDPKLIYPGQVFVLPNE